MATAALWEPHACALHELILRLDISTIAWHNYRCLSGRISALNNSERHNRLIQLGDEFRLVRTRAIGLRWNYLSVLTDRCVAETADWCIADAETTIVAAVTFMERIRIAMPLPHPSTGPSMPEKPNDHEARSVWSEEFADWEKESDRFNSGGGVLPNPCTIVRAC